MKFGPLAGRAAAGPILLVILAAAAVLRFQGLNWDQNTHLHPDERFITMVATALDWPRSLGEYFDTAASPLNPYNRNFGTYVYGTFPLFLTKFVAEKLFDMGGYDRIFLVGRALSALADLATIVLAFLIGRRLYGPAVGLLTAGLLAFTVLHIQQAHFWTVDPPGTFLTTLGLYFAVDLAFGGRPIPALLGLGTSFGLALATKINLGLFAGVIGLAWALRWLLARNLPPAGGPGPWGWSGRLAGWEVYLQARPTGAVGSRRPALAGAAAGFILTLVVAFLVFRAAQPYAFRGLGLNPQWVQDMEMIGRLIAGEVDYPPGHQWAARTPYVFPWVNMVQWGLGWPLGLAAWAGVALAGYELVFRRRVEHLLPLAWVLLVFGYLGGGFVLTMRYFFPIYPCLVMLAAYLLVRTWEAARRFGRAGATLAAGLALAVVGATVLWALAFTQIYRQPHSRIEASRWIYANIPPGSVLGYEHWDDPLPLPIDGRNPAELYRGVELPLYNDDTPEKLYGYPNQPGSGLLDKLDRVDYIILSSNRLYGSIPRLPMRYPMTVRYYQALFSGELGFERVRTFNSFPGLFGLSVNDQGAEEAFTVYDHPQVDIFKKTPAYSRARAEQILGAVDWDSVRRVTALEVSRAPTGLMLRPEDLPVYEQAFTWAEAFQRASPVNTSQALAVLVWLLAVEILGLAAFPVVRLGLGGLVDGGWAAAKVFGLLAVAWLVWVGASLRAFSFTGPAVVGAALGLVLAGVIVGLATRRELADFIRRRWWALAAGEAVFLGAFGAFLRIRMGNPDLWHPVMGGEKPMDFAFLNAIIRSPYFPPYDPWFAGGYINYYYFGFVLVAVLVKLTGIVPWVAYNLAIPTWFGLTAAGAFGVAASLGRALRAESGAEPGPGPTVGWGLLGPLFVAVIGNLGEARLYVGALAGLGRDVPSTLPGFGTLLRVLAGLGRVVFDGQPLVLRPEWPYWNPTRVIPDTINEFPFFTFLYADLHPHLLALPLTLGTLAAAVAAVVAPPKSEDLRSRLVRVGLLSLGVGALWPANTWDFPTYFGLAALGIGLAEYRRSGRLDVSWALAAGWQTAAVLILGRLLFGPFFAYYAVPYTSFELWRGPRTGLYDYLTVHGFFLFVVGSWLLWEAWPVLRPDADFLERLLLYAGLALAALLLFTGAGAQLVGALVLGLSLVNFFRPGASAGRRFVFALAGIGAALTLLVEFLVLRGDIGRMNTVFKFYVQVWVLWGIAAAVGLAEVGRDIRLWRPELRQAWVAVLGVLLAAVLSYPVLATAAKIRDRFPGAEGFTLDGRAFMEQAVYQDRQPLALKDDRLAIDWLLDNVRGSPVILEGHAPEYRWGSRFAVYTGLPAVVGWNWHERQQRAIYTEPLVERRIQEVTTIYNTPDPAQALRLLGRYRVRYIIVGGLERAYYDPAGLAKFDRMAAQGLLEIVYRQGAVAIYRVPGG